MKKTTVDGAIKPPAFSKILIIGGGPAGSIAASILAREGLEVTLLEKEKFPRYHIGESLLVSLIPILNFVGADKKVADYGFIKKYGAYFRLKQDVAPGHIDFRKRSQFNHSYQVERAEFDQLLLEHAREQKVQVFEETEVTDIEFIKGVPVSLKWKQVAGESGETKFDYLIDASGLGGIISNKYLQNRSFQPNFDNVALVKYWKDYQDYTDVNGEAQPGAFFLEALTNGAGWCWSIPLRNNRISSGIVIKNSYFLELKKEFGDLEAVYSTCLALCPDTSKTILTGASPLEEVKVWNDYSYVGNSFSGSRYRLIGDAAGFIDPFFSTGVHMALLGALSASATICAEIKGECTEAEAISFHDKCVRQAYVRYLLIVSAFYKQMHNQEEVVLHGVDKDTFQEAFDLIQPIVSGNMDLATDKISNDKIMETLNFISNMREKSVDFEKQGVATKIILKEMDKQQYDEISVTNRFGAIDGLYINMKVGDFGLTKLSFTDRAMRKMKRTLFNVIWRVGMKT